MSLYNKEFPAFNLLTFFFNISAREITSLHLSTSLRVLNVLDIDDATLEDSVKVYEI
jgi:hypothetical protein